MSHVSPQATQAVSGLGPTARLQAPPPIAGDVAEDAARRQTYASGVASSFATEPEDADPGAPTIDESLEFGTFDRAAILFQVRLWNFIRRIFLLTPLLLVFFVAIASSILNWRRYDKETREATWLKTRCFIVRTAVTNDTDRLETTENAFRAEVLVRGYGLEDANEEVIAFFGTEGNYNMSKANAQEQIDSLVVDLSKVAKCYMKLSEPRRVSMAPVATPHVSKGSLWVAWVSSFVAAGSGFIMLLIILQDIRLNVSAERSNFRTGLGNQIDHSDEKRGFLTSSQAKHVVAKYSETIPGTGLVAKEWSCSICLEDNDGAEIRTAVLPCSHRFHRSCIRKWLRRGAATCPLCNWDVSSLFDSAGSAKPTEDETPLVADPGSVQIAEAIVGSNEPGESANHDSENPHPIPPPPPANPLPLLRGSRTSRGVAARSADVGEPGTGGLVRRRSRDPRASDGVDRDRARELASVSTGESPEGRPSSAVAGPQGAGSVLEQADGQSFETQPPPPEPA